VAQLPMMENPAPKAPARPPTVPSLESALVDLRSTEGAGSPTLVLVVWHDAWTDSEQHCEDDWRPDYPVRTVGFLVRHERYVVSVAQEILPEGDGYRSVTHIPTSMIESMTTLASLVPKGNGSGNGHAKRA